MYKLFLEASTFLNLYRDLNFHLKVWLIGIFKPIVNVRLGKALKGKLSPSFRFPIWLDMILFIYLTLMRLFG